MAQPYLTTGEFTRAMSTLSTEMSRRFDKVDETGVDHAERITALETHSKIRERATKKEVKKNASGWSAAVTTGIIVIIEVGKHFFGSK